MSDASELLRRLAHRAAGRPALPERGRYDYVRTAGRHRGSRSRLGRDGTLTPIESWVDLTERELWVAADGSGRIEETHSGRRSRASGRYGPGGMHRWPELPTDPDELERVLEREFGADRRGRGTSRWFHVVREVWAGRVIAPALQSALLTVLATKPDLVARGRATDALGREGLAVSTDTVDWGRPWRYVLLLDPDSGMLTAQQTVELVDGRPDPEAERSGYTAWRRSAHVDSTDERPSE